MIELYNEHVFTGGGFIAPMALAAVPADRQPSACIGCGKCADVCPQQIDIPGIMKDFAQSPRSSGRESWPKCCTERLPGPGTRSVS